MIRALIGIAMRLYRRSPLHPHLGAFLARCLGRLHVLRGGGLKRCEIGGLVYELDLEEVIDASLYYSRTFEVNMERRIDALLKPGMVAIDVGANVGYHTLRMARAVGAQGRVLAIEPMSRAFARLSRNLELNGFPNVDRIQEALSDRDLGVVPTRFQSSYRLDGRAIDVVEPIRIRTLDDLVRERALARLDLIKLDVDGYEGRFLRGALATLEQHRCALLLEISPDAMRALGDDPAELVATLTRLGYRFETEEGAPIADLDRCCADIPAGLSQNIVALRK